MAIFSPYFSEIEEFCSFLIKGYMETTTKTDSTDIDDFVSRELGYKVTYESFADSDSDALGFTSDGSTAIYVNRDGERQLVLFPAKRIILDKVLLRKEYEHKRRFVLAHEAGHIIAHKKYGAPLECFNRDYGDASGKTRTQLRECMSVDESRANRIAAALLMPTFLINEAFRKYNNGRRIRKYGTAQFLPEDREVMQKISNQLNVSYAALFYRLRDLDCFENHSMEEYLQIMKERMT